MVISRGRSGATAEYRERLLSLLGDRDPLEVQAALPERLGEALTDLDAAALSLAEGPGKWSILEVVRHLADSEMVYGYRMRAILAEEEPALAGYDQEEWARSLRYAAGGLDEALELLFATRRANLALVRGLAESELERAGFHGERGRETISDIVALLAAHDLVHVAQIERIRTTHGL